MTNKRKSKRTTSVADKTKGSAVTSSAPTKVEAGLKPFSSAQLTALVFLSMGVSRVAEWKRAVYELTNKPASQGGNNNTTSLCAEYFTKTSDDDNETDVVNYSDVCELTSTHTLLRLKYDTSLQVTAIVVLLMLQCWQNERQFSVFNAMLCGSPISTTLVILQMSLSYLSFAKSRSITVTCILILLVAAPQVAQFLREVRQGEYARPTARRGMTSVTTIWFLALIGACGYQMAQWVLLVVQEGGSNHAVNLEQDGAWHPAMKVIVYTLIQDQFTLAVLFAFVWQHMAEFQQRRFLFSLAILKGVEYGVQWQAYSTDDIPQLEAIKTAVLVTSVVSAIVAMVSAIGTMAPSSGGGSNAIGKTKTA